MKLFQKALLFLLVCCLMLPLSACGNSQNRSGVIETTPTTAVPTEPAVPFVPVEKVTMDTTGMTQLQKAIVVTAESYYLHRKYAQYDQYALTSMNKSNVSRRLVGIMAPEDYTAQYYGYTDCSSFVYDVYKFALGMSIDKSAWTKSYCTNSQHEILMESPKSDGFADMSADELAVKEKEFRDTLQPGDIIAYRYADGNSGHAILYVGNNKIIHSTGSTYDFETGADKVEKNGTYRYESLDNLFVKNKGMYLFNKSVYVILRPLNAFRGDIPEQTQQRMGVMRGITAEKLCSHTYGVTVSPGDSLTYTFRIKNNTSRAVTLSVKDTVPAGTDYVSGANSVAGDALSWQVTVDKSDSVEISYTVQVKADTPTGTFIQSKSTVGGITTKCPRVQVARTLTANEQQAILDAQKALSNSKLKGIQLANAIYEKGCGKAVFTAKDTDALWDDLVSAYNNIYFFMNTRRPLAAMVAPRLYGGRLMGELYDDSAHTQYRTRLVTKELLVIGDIVLADDTLYLFTGTGLLDLSTEGYAGLFTPEALLIYNQFAVLRPSMMF